MERQDKGDAMSDITGYTEGTWDIDTVHSEVGFSVRHMMVSKVRGKFNEFSGAIVTGEKVTESTVNAEIQLASINTGNADRDAHIRSADFFSVEEFPTMTYHSTGVRNEDGEYILDGELTLKGRTRDVPLTLEIGGFGPDPYGNTRAGFSAKGEIKRSDFGVDFNAALETGGVVVGDKILLELEIEAVLRA